MKISKILGFEIALFLVAAVFLYQISFSQIQISEKSPKNQRNESFIFPKNFTNLKTPLYSRLIFIILDGITYDYVDSRIKEIPDVEEDCEIHIHKMKFFNDILNENPGSTVLQRLEIEPPPKTEIKIQTYLKGTNPVVFSMKIPEQNPHQIKMEDSLLYQIGQADHLKENYGFLTYYLYDYLGYQLKINQFALNPYYKSYEQLKQSEEQRVYEYLNIIKSKNYETLFIYEGLFDETTHSEGMHSQQGLDAQRRIDEILREAAQNMDDDALMVVVSDHGKSESGGHFNCRNEDTKVCNSLFFAYTKKGFIKNDKFIESLRRAETNSRISSQGELFLAHESMISSTISNILNIPISFVNSGRSLFEIYPKSKFENRIEMLQRILQDSFTTLQQQVELYRYIQDIRQTFDSSYFQQIINQVFDIEILLYYETKDVIIYSEERLEETITRIVNIQNQIQKSIYEDTQFYSNKLLVFGIIFGACVCLAIFFLSFQELILKNSSYKDYLFILLMTTYSCYIYIRNEQNDLEAFGCQLSVILFIYQFLKVYKNKEQMLCLIGFVVLNILIYFRNQFLNLQQITFLCEMIIFGIYFKQIKDLQNSTRSMKYYTLAFTFCIVILEVLSLYKYSEYFFAIKLIFYVYSCYIQYQQNSNFYLKEFKIDLILLNLIYHLIILFLQNSQLKSGLSYFPIVLLNAYLLAYAISLSEKVYYSYFTQTHIYLMSAVFYQVLNLETRYYHTDFSIFLIVLFFFPIPFIGQMFYSKCQHQPDKLIEDIEQRKLIKVQVSEDEEIEENKIQQKNHKIETFRNTRIYQIKGGLILISAVCLIFSCIGQLWMILNKQVFADNQFIFNNEYIMITVVCMLAANLFIRE
ncbi:type I phosphodiesterase/nucleotide pyrophosphatase (macronuclear) [Tetrahymena thermophila SB210]|uniref:Type I phosphodiesterase/nucleotide pyrophosphatase n=1 Tax=Tetrahymena thermophila (strain SB210) TaxID=312017 RepID=I7MKQ0_TETTS|nr:type I phosphodiesterase/nucleotide pyrophosphatase [Tetrahymena thermophila SB210]EAR99703.2 type I phosphodiesterase/nucleotide pyrophosphatase [Tetrahymena thermophila SB210]|eukprot:XP_001019948.2 type I phosphodiesterase/nucleotide pyrophosphatase [Tetrahymena thermophila SB210]